MSSISSIFNASLVNSYHIDFFLLTSRHVFLNQKEADDDLLVTCPDISPLTTSNCCGGKSKTNDEGSHII